MKNDNNKIRRTNLSFSKKKKNYGNMDAII